MPTISNIIISWGAELSISESEGTQTITVVSNQTASDNGNEIKLELIDEATGDEIDFPPGTNIFNALGNQPIEQVGTSTEYKAIFDIDISKYVCHLEDRKTYTIKAIMIDSSQQNVNDTDGNPIVYNTDFVVKNKLFTVDSIEYQWNYNIGDGTSSSVLNNQTKVGDGRIVLNFPQDKEYYEGNTGSRPILKINKTQFNNPTVTNNMRTFTYTIQQADILKFNNGYNCVEFDMNSLNTQIYNDTFIKKNIEIEFSWGTILNKLDYDNSPTIKVHLYDSFDSNLESVSLKLFDDSQTPSEITFAQPSQSTNNNITTFTIANELDNINDDTYVIKAIVKKNTDTITYITKTFVLNKKIYNINENDKLYKWGAANGNSFHPSQYSDSELNFDNRLQWALFRFPLDAAYVNRINTNLKPILKINNNSISQPDTNTNIAGNIISFRVNLNDSGSSIAIDGTNCLELDFNTGNNQLYNDTFLGYLVKPEFTGIDFSWDAVLDSLDTGSLTIDVFLSKTIGQDNVTLKLFDSSNSEILNGQSNIFSDISNSDVTYSNNRTKAIFPIGNRLNGLSDGNYQVTAYYTYKGMTNNLSKSFIINRKIYNITTSLYQWGAANGNSFHPSQYSDSELNFDNRLQWALFKFTLDAAYVNRIDSNLKPILKINNNSISQPDTNTNIAGDIISFRVNLNDSGSSIAIDGNNCLELDFNTGNNQVYNGSFIGYLVKPEFTGIDFSWDAVLDTQDTGSLTIDVFLSKTIGQDNITLKLFDSSNSGVLITGQSNNIFSDIANSDVTYSNNRTKAIFPIGNRLNGLSDGNYQVTAYYTFKGMTSNLSKSFIINRKIYNINENDKLYKWGAANGDSFHPSQYSDSELNFDNRLQWALFKFTLDAAYVNRIDSNLKPILKINNNSISQPDTNTNIAGDIISFRVNLNDSGSSIAIDGTNCLELDFNTGNNQLYNDTFLGYLVKPEFTGIDFSWDAVLDSLDTGSLTIDVFLSKTIGQDNVTLKLFDSSNSEILNGQSNIFSDIANSDVTYSNNRTKASFPIGNRLNGLSDGNYQVTAYYTFKGMTSNLSKSFIINRKIYNINENDKLYKWGAANGNSFHPSQYSDSELNFDNRLQWALFRFPLDTAYVNRINTNLKPILKINNNSIYQPDTNTNIAGDIISFRVNLNDSGNSIAIDGTNCLELDFNTGNNQVYNDTFLGYLVKPEFTGIEFSWDTVLDSLDTGSLTIDVFLSKTIEQDNVTLKLFDSSNGEVLITGQSNNIFSDIANSDVTYSNNRTKASFPIGNRLNGLSDGNYQVTAYYTYKGMTNNLSKSFLKNKNEYDTPSVNYYWGGNAFSFTQSEYNDTFLNIGNKEKYGLFKFTLSKTYVNQDTNKKPILIVNPDQKDSNGDYKYEYSASNNPVISGSSNEIISFSIDMGPNTDFVAKDGTNIVLLDINTGNQQIFNYTFEAHFTPPEITSIKFSWDDILNKTESEIDQTIEILTTGAVDNDKVELELYLKNTSDDQYISVVDSNGDNILASNNLKIMNNKAIISGGTLSPTISTNILSNLINNRRYKIKVIITTSGNIYSKEETFDVKRVLLTTNDPTYQWGYGENQQSNILNFQNNQFEAKIIFTITGLETFATNKPILYLNDNSLVNSQNVSLVEENGNQYTFTVPANIVQSIENGTNYIYLHTNSYNGEEFNFSFDARLQVSTITDINLSWGNVLNLAESETDQTIEIFTTNARNSDNVILRLYEKAGQTYNQVLADNGNNILSDLDGTLTINNNNAIITSSNLLPTISKDILGDLIHNTSYKINVILTTDGADRTDDSIDFRFNKLIPTINPPTFSWSRDDSTYGVLKDIINTQIKIDSSSSNRVITYKIDDWSNIEYKFYLNGTVINNNQIFFNNSGQSNLKIRLIPDNINNLITGINYIRVKIDDEGNTVERTDTIDVNYDTQLITTITPSWNNCISNINKTVNQQINQLNLNITGGTIPQGTIKVNTRNIYDFKSVAKKISLTITGIFGSDSSSSVVNIATDSNAINIANGLATITVQDTFFTNLNNNQTYIIKANVIGSENAVAEVTYSFEVVYTNPVFNNIPFELSGTSNGTYANIEDKIFNLGDQAIDHFIKVKYDHTSIKTGSTCELLLDGKIYGPNNLNTSENNTIFKFLQNDDNRKDDIKALNTGMTKISAIITSKGNQTLISKEFRVNFDRPEVVSLTTSWGSVLNIAEAATEQTIDIVTRHVRNNESSENAKQLDFKILNSAGNTIQSTQKNQEIVNNVDIVRLGQSLLNDTSKFPNGMNYKIILQVNTDGNQLNQLYEYVFEVYRYTPVITSIGNLWGEVINIAESNATNGQTITINTQDYTVIDGSRLKASINRRTYEETVNNNQVSINIPSQDLVELSKNKNDHKITIETSSNGNPYDNSSDNDSKFKFATYYLTPIIDSITWSWNKFMNIEDKGKAQTITVVFENYVHNRTILTYQIIDTGNSNNVIYPPSNQQSITLHDGIITTIDNGKKQYVINFNTSQMLDLSSLLIDNDISGERYHVKLTLKTHDNPALENLNSEAFGTNFLRPRITGYDLKWITIQQNNSDDLDLKDFEENTDKVKINTSATKNTSKLTLKVFNVDVNNVIGTQHYIFTDNDLNNDLTTNDIFLRKPNSDSIFNEGEIKKYILDAIVITDGNVSDTARSNIFTVDFLRPIIIFSTVQNTSWYDENRNKNFININKSLTNATIYLETQHTEINDIALIKFNGQEYTKEDKGTTIEVTIPSKDILELESDKSPYIMTVDITSRRNKAIQKSILIYVDYIRPKIIDVIYSWGKILDISETGDESDVKIITQNAEDDREITFLLNSLQYTGTIKDNSVTFPIPNEHLQILEFKRNYNGTIAVTNEAENSLATSNSLSPDFILRYIPPDNGIICFLADTPIETDQGIYPINELNSDYSINNQKIIAITEVKNTDNYMILFKKNSLGKNIPNQDTYISKLHGIYIRDKLIKAENLVNNNDIYPFVTGYKLIYNVLLLKHSKMKVNNIEVETLNPNSKFAKQYIKQTRDRVKMVLFKKHCMGRNNPPKDTIIPKSRNIYIKNKPYTAASLINNTTIKQIIINKKDIVENKYKYTN